MEEKTSDEHIRIQTNLIGQRFANASMSRIAFGDLNAESISKWVKNKKGFLVYLGAPGIGKTYLCSALIPWVHHKFRSYRYWKERDFLSRLRSSMEGSGDYIREISYMMDDEFIMVDDVGSCGFNEWRSEVLFSMIDFRYESGKPTVITSNLTRQALTEGLGLRAASRLFASENLVIEIHEGQDLRKDGM